MQRKEVSRCRVILSTSIISVSDSPITVTFSDSPNHSCLTRPLCPSDSADMAHPSPLVSLVEKQFRGAWVSCMSKKDFSQNWKLVVHWAVSRATTVCRVDWRLIVQQVVWPLEARLLLRSDGARDVHRMRLWCVHVGDAEYEFKRPSCSRPASCDLPEETWRSTVKSKHIRTPSCTLIPKSILDHLGQSCKELRCSKEILAEQQTPWHLQRQVSMSWSQLAVTFHSSSSAFLNERAKTSDRDVGFEMPCGDWSRSFQVDLSCGRLLYGFNLSCTADASVGECPENVRDQLNPFSPHFQASSGPNCFSESAQWLAKDLHDWIIHCYKIL